MYLDFSKFNYSLIPKDEIKTYIKRDKQAYKEILNTWLEENIEEIIERKWEIEEILFIDEDSDFIKLLKEAESLYEFGFYTSCISLIGTAAEDCTKFFAIRMNASNLINETQYIRLKKMLEGGLIRGEEFSVLDKIRLIRNDCVHYNENFKLKNSEELKKDALEILNTFKDLIRIFFGFKDEVTLEKYEEIIDASIRLSLKKNTNIKNIRELTLKQRNIVSQLFNVDITIQPGIEKLSQESVYKIQEIDFNFKEFTLFDMKAYMPVIVDLSEKEIQHLKDINLKENEFVYAAITSTVSLTGQTEEWRLMRIKKLQLKP